MRPRERSQNQLSLGHTPHPSYRQHVGLVRHARAWHNGAGVSGWRSYWTCCGR
jgi:hypothetical protein